MKKIFLNMMKMLPVITLIAGSLTGVMTYVNVGYTDTFYISWLKSFLVAVFIIIPITMPIIDKIADKIEQKFKDKHFLLQKLYFSLIVGGIMESIMAISTTLTNKGFTDRFLINWFNAFIVSVPVGICIGFLMSLTLVPLMKKYIS